MKTLQRFGGDLSERSGVYFSCHAEKLLAVWVLEECIFHTTQTREVNKDTIANLKILIDQVPLRLRDTMIDLDHKPCHSCINVSITLFNGGIGRRFIRLEANN